MRLTVLGKSPSWPDAGGACSGYLLEEAGTRVLIDCGNGVFGKMRQFCDYTEIDAVVISHFHADHVLDLVPFAYALTYAPRQQPVPVDRWPGTDSPARPRLCLPPEGQDKFRRVVGVWGGSDLIDNAFHVEEYDPGAELSLGPLRVRFNSVPHFTETFAMRITSADGEGCIGYGADSRPDEALCRFVSSADLLLIEATLPRPERTGERGHLTPREAGEHGSRAGAERLVITHISDELDGEWAQREAAEGFGGPVELAREGAVYEV